MNEELLTPAEAARRARVNADTIRRWIRVGALPAAKMGTSHSSHLRIRPEDLDRLLIPTGPKRVERAEPAQAA